MPPNSNIRRRKPKFKFTHQKQHKVKKDANYPVPTDEEWKAMKIFTRLKLNDDEGQTYLFKVSDCVTVLPPDAPQSKDGTSPPLSKMWVARIEGIRQQEHDGEVWLKVRWFYTPEDAKRVIKNFDTTLCGHHERLISSHHDIIHSTTIDELIEVKCLVGGGTAIIKEPPINSEDVYYRYNLEIARKQLKADYSIRPKLSESCGLCCKPYAPPDSEYACGEESEGNLTEMRFCPRASCFEAFHVSCLYDKGYCQASQVKQSTSLDTHIHATHRALSVLGAISGRTKSGDDDDDYMYILRLLKAISLPVLQQRTIKQEQEYDLDESHGEVEVATNDMTDSDTGRFPDDERLPPPPPFPACPLKIPRTLLALAVQPLSRGAAVAEPKSITTSRLEVALWGSSDMTMPESSQGSGSARSSRSSRGTISGNVGIVCRARQEVCNIIENTVKSQVKEEAEDADNSVMSSVTVPSKRKREYHDTSDAEHTETTDSDGESDYQEENWISRVLQQTSRQWEKRNSECASGNSAVAEADIQLIVPYILHIPPSGLFSALLGPGDEIVDMKGGVIGHRDAWRHILDTSSRLDSGATLGDAWLTCPSCGGLI
ncbi:phd finger transcription [Moniliophthora roreri MCA 2997]|uniref:Phd finger transcription n=1 Tax=Moniliophthora roreri (strain MCA 2997) TaxID=1381753 RepID=V2WZK3_MONRO|nr:phd finger transcription [Moniliophthora roreri MCA 2997]